MFRVTGLHSAKWLRSVNHSEVGEQRRSEIIHLEQLCHTNGTVGGNSGNVVHVASSMQKSGCEIISEGASAVMSSLSLQ